MLERIDWSEKDRISDQVHMHVNDMIKPSDSRIRSSIEWIFSFSLSRIQTDNAFCILLHRISGISDILAQHYV
jgi:hypothetical protein